MNCEYKRSCNFSTQEVQVLIELVKKHKNIIECKKSDAHIWRQKEEAWQQLTDDFNSNQHSQEYRTAKVLKAKWENLKKNSKKKFSAEKEEIYKMGAGKIDVSKISSQDEDIKDILGMSVTGLQSFWDSDFIEEPTSENDTVQNNEIEYVFEETEKQINTYTDEFHQRPSSPSSTIVSLKGNCAISTRLSMLTRSRSRQNIKQEPVEIPDTEEIKQQKTTITEDCRVKINCVSDAKLNLLRLQRACLEEQEKRSKEEHSLKMAHLKEIHALEIAKRKLELEILKKNVK